jgi:tripartite-type tricarboxylate transporter receptor subunit TctC
MNVQIRTLVLLSMVVTPVAAFAQAFPSRPINLVCPFPPGSTSDLLPRALAPLMSQSLGVPVIVDNRPGASGAIGAGFVAKSEPGGHTLLMAPTGVLAINQWLYKELAYNPEKDFVPIINAASTPNMWVVHPSVPANDLKGLIALAKANPDSLSFASGGNGSTSHLCGELLKISADIKMVHIPYKGPASAHQDLLAGRIPLMCDNFSNVIPHVRAGRLRAIALTGKTRHPQAPDVPTADESGLPGFDVGVWYSFVAPAATSKPVIHKLNAEFAKALRAPVVAERLETLGLTVVADSPEEFGKFIAAESAKWRKVVQVSGARPD